MVDVDVVIIGGGVAGLAAARQLEQHKINYVLIDGGSELGGRLATKTQDGFILDRGFQVLLSQYPEVKAKLDLSRLKLKTFLPGALIYKNGKLHTFADPWRQPMSLLRTLLSGLFSLRDYWLIWRLRQELLSKSEQGWFLAEDNRSTFEFLSDYGFSQNIIECFFRPFFGGVFLEHQLETRASHFKYFFYHFALGSSGIPERGIQAISDQLVSPIPSQRILLSEKVLELGDQSLLTSKQRRISFRYAILACEQPEAWRLLGVSDESVVMKRTQTFYFTGSYRAFKSPWLVLIADPNSLIQTCTYLSNLGESFAPPGKVLISATLKYPAEDPAVLVDRVKDELEIVLSSQGLLEFLDICDVKSALPRQVGEMKDLPKLAPKVFLAGDYLGKACLQTAMLTGRQAAEAVVRMTLPIPQA